MTLSGHFIPVINNSLVMRKPKWSEYGFHLSRNSRLGIYGLLLVLLLLIVINALLPLWTAPKNNSENEALTQAWTQFLAKNKNNQNQAATAKMTNSHLFSFDPNTISKEDLIALDLPMKTVYTWLHYREKGGHFYKNKDLKKLYTLSQKDYERIVPYSQVIAKQSEKFSYKGLEASQKLSKPASEQNLILPLNQTDTTALKKLPGIGSVFARRIVLYRARLGGFYSATQLKEIYGLPDSTFRKIAGHFTVNPKIIKKINLNRAFFKDLAHHPYLRPYAKEILRLRSQLGRFSSVEQLRQIDLINEQKYRKIAPYLSI